eukprot:UN26291
MANGAILNFETFPLDKTLKSLMGQVTKIDSEAKKLEDSLQIMGEKFTAKLDNNKKEIPESNQTKKRQKTLCISH